MNIPNMGNQGESSVNLEISDKTKDLLPCKPERPLDSDCCGSGCIPCVFDIYDQEVAMWEKECKHIKQKAIQKTNSQQDIGQFISEDKYHEFTISQISKESHDTYRYRFRLPEDKTLGLQLGQHVVIRVRNKDVLLTRQYTPVSDINSEGYFDLIIKVYDKGQMSKYVESWKTGTPVEMRGPFGCFPYKTNKYRRLLMIAAGTGIAPMAQIIQAVLNNENDETYVRLVYACRTYQDILLKKELDEWAGYWNFSVLYVLSQEPSVTGSYRYGDDIFKGRIDKELISVELNKYETVSDILVTVCGTRSFDTDMVELCKALQVPQQQIFKF